MLDVILVENAVELHDIPVNVKAYLNSVVHHEWNRNHIDSKIDHEGLERECATQVRKVILLVLLLHSDD